MRSFAYIVVSIYKHGAKREDPNMRDMRKSRVDGPRLFVGGYVPIDLAQEFNALIEEKRAAHFKKNRTLSTKEMLTADAILRQRGRDAHEDYVQSIIRPSDHSVSKSSILREVIALGIEAYKANHPTVKQGTESDGTDISGT